MSLNNLNGTRNINESAAIWISINPFDSIDHTVEMRIHSLLNQIRYIKRRILLNAPCPRPCARAFTKCKRLSALHCTQRSRAYKTTHLRTHEAAVIRLTESICNINRCISQREKRFNECVLCFVNRVARRQPIHHSLLWCNAANATTCSFFSISRLKNTI